ncbi:MAG: DoxX family membrane protein [Hyphomicrobiaceae bacterium]
MHKLVHAAANAFDLVPHSLIALLARLIMAVTFFKSWLTKVDLATMSIKSSTFYLFANEYKLPLIPSDLAAYLTVVAELVLPVLLVLGLLSRYAALAMLGMTLVIQVFVYPNAYAMHGLWAVSLLYVMKYGPGVLALDHLLWGDGNQRRSST